MPVLLPPKTQTKDFSYSNKRYMKFQQGEREIERVPVPDIKKKTDDIHYLIIKPFSDPIQIPQEDGICVRIVTCLMMKIHPMKQRPGKKPKPGNFLHLHGSFLSCTMSAWSRSRSSSHQSYAGYGQIVDLSHQIFPS